MKKNILAVAVATAMIAPAVSMAGATFYGHAQVELAQTETDAPGPAGDSELQVVDNKRGRIGMAASEDLGNGWKGLAKFEFLADTADGNATDGATKTVTTVAPDTDTTSTTAVALGTRELMVGLKGPMGQVELGRIKQAYKYTGGVKYDAFVTTMLEARGNGGMSKKPKNFSAGGHSSFHANALGYRKKVGPIKLSLTYGPSTDDGSYTFSAMFKKGGIEAFVAAVDGGDNKLPASYSSTKIGGKFKTGAHSVMVQLESTSEDSGTATVDPAYTFLAYHMKMGKNVFVLNYGLYDSDTAGGVKDSTYLALGVIHNFSKKTRVYAGYRATDVDDDLTGNTAITVGIRKTFKGG